MLSEIEKDSHSLKNLFDVVLHDADDQPLSWTKGLVISSSLPTFAFEVSAQNAGSTKGYTGWSLPEYLSLSMYETRQHDLEKYLLDWIFGERGIFDLATGTFRAADKESYLYRKVTFRTTTYEVSVQGTLEHQRIELSQAIEHTLQTVIDDLVGGKLSLSDRQNITSATSNLSSFLIKEYSKGEFTTVDKAQAVPVVDKVTTAISQSINQLLTTTPVVSVLTAPVIIPPPVLKVPVSSVIKVPKNINTYEFTEVPKNDYEQKVSQFVFSNNESKSSLQSGIDSINSILNSLPKGIYSEKTISTSTYRVALQSYNVSQYDYSTGEPVTYDLQLPLTDYTLPEFVS